jgi:beta-xylosidase
VPVRPDQSYVEWEETPAKMGGTSHFLAVLFKVHWACAEILERQTSSSKNEPARLELKMSESIGSHHQAQISIQRSARMEIALPIKNMVRAVFAGYGTGGNDGSQLPSQMGLNDKQIGRFIPFFALFL